MRACSMASAHPWAPTVLTASSTDHGSRCGDEAGLLAWSGAWSGQSASVEPVDRLRTPLGDQLRDPLCINSSKAIAVRRSLLAPGSEPRC